MLESKFLEVFMWFSESFSKQSSSSRLLSSIAMSFVLLTSTSVSTNLYAKKNTDNVKTEENKEAKDKPEEVKPLPELKNTSYILMDYATGQVLAEKNINEKLPPASLTKMMTSYLLEQRLTAGKIKENDEIQVSKSAACNLKKGESCMFLRKGKPVKAIDVLRGIVIQSGNDASRAIAEHIGGTEEKFVSMMNAEAKKIGMTNTQFKNATGMPAEGHYSTAKDLALLAQAIIRKNSRYYPIYSEKTFTYGGIKQYNRNRLLFTGQSTDGLKTGHTNEAGYCLVASAKREDFRLISVVLGTNSKKARTDQSRKVLNWGFDNFKTRHVADNKTFITKSKVWFGEKNEVNLALGTALDVIIPKTIKGKINTETNFPETLEAPLKKGQKVGEMNAVVNGKVVATAPVIVTEDVPEAGFFGRLWDKVTLFFNGLLGK